MQRRNKPEKSRKLFFEKPFNQSQSNGYILLKNKVAASVQKAGISIDETVCTYKEPVKTVMSFKRWDLR